MQMTNSEVLKLVNLIWIMGFAKNRGVLMVKTENENEVK